MPRASASTGLTLTYGSGSSSRIMGELLNMVWVLNLQRSLMNVSGYWANSSFSCHASSGGSQNQQDSFFMSHSWPTLAMGWMPS